jgi:hypothetical protein
MSNKALNLTRNDIARIANNDPRVIKALEDLLNSSGGAAWVNIDFTNSNITDILTRLHDDLQSIGEADETSSNAVKNKHVSNKQLKDLHDRQKTNEVLLWLSM